MRKEVFANNEFYHVFNRGVDKRKVFLRRGHYIRFITTIRNLLHTGRAQPGLLLNQSLALNKKLSFICYCLMPNHYHFLVRQLEDGGITDFMHKLNTSYTKYFNLNHKRVGRLFEYTFKAVHVESEEQLVHLSRYIHLNPLLSNLITNLSKYQWSSYPDFIGIRNGTLCQKQEIIGFFKGENPEKLYERFVLDQIDYSREIKKLEKLLLEESL